MANNGRRIAALENRIAPPSPDGEYIYSPDDRLIDPAIHFARFIEWLITVQERAWAAGPCTAAPDCFYMWLPAPTWDFCAAVGLDLTHVGRQTTADGDGRHGWPSRRRWMLPDYERIIEPDMTPEQYRQALTEQRQAQRARQVDHLQQGIAWAQRWLDQGGGGDEQTTPAHFRRELELRQRILDDLKAQWAALDALREQLPGILGKLGQDSEP